MPLHEVVYLPHHTKLYLWKITESLETLSEGVTLKESSLDRLAKMKSSAHQRGFYAVRQLLQHIGYTDLDLYYDTSGKPHLKPQGCSGESVEISISHSHGFSALVVSKQVVGLDIEQIRPKILSIAPRFMELAHLENLSQETQQKKATVIWGIKECIFKIKNEKGISFPNHISESKFLLEDKSTQAQLHFNQITEKFTAYFDTVEDYIFVVAFECLK